MTGKRQWSDLQTELLVLMMLNLSFVDLVRVQSVCKVWRSVVERLPCCKAFPFSMSWIGKSFFSCQLRYAADSRRHYIVKDTGIRGRGNTDTLQIWGSKQGWLLIGRKIGCSDYKAVFFFYSPFSYHIIEAPHFKTSGEEVVVATFSFPPTSPDCLIMAITTSPVPSMFGCPFSMERPMSIRICLLREKDWTTTDFNRDLQFEVAKVAVYVNGIFFILSAKGKLATFDVANQTTRVLPIKTTVSNRAHIVEYCGEIFLVDGHANVSLAHILKYETIVSDIYRLNTAQERLVKVRRLRDRALFVSPQSVLFSELVGSDAPLNKGYQISEMSFGLSQLLDVNYLC